MKKVVEIDEHAHKELMSFSAEIQARFDALFRILERDGHVREPNGKRINQDLFELRIKYCGQWRSLYAYLKNDKVIILVAFHKTTQKTPKQIIQTANKRLRRNI